MDTMDNLVEALDELTIEQLEQLNVLLGAVRRYLPEDKAQSAMQIQRRQHYLRKAISQLRAGLTNTQLNQLIDELKQAS